MPGKTETPWLFENGTPKPEYSMSLRAALSDGTKVLHLQEPTVKAIRRATKHLQFENGEPTSESGIAFGVSLIAGVTGLPDDIIEELTQTHFRQAVDYLQSFS